MIYITLAILLSSYLIVKAIQNLNKSEMEKQDNYDSDPDGVFNRYELTNAKDWKTIKKLLRHNASNQYLKDLKSAIDCTYEVGHVSVSLLERRLNFGETKSRYMIDLMQSAGVISSTPNGNSIRDYTPGI